MHPILQDWRRFATWMTAWIPVGAILVLVVHLSGRLTYLEASAVMAPAVLVFAFVCLSPFYVCRSLPLRSAAPGRLFANHLAAAVVLSSGVMLIGRFTATMLAGAFPGVEQRYSSAVPVLAVIVLLIYEMAIALHYAALEMESSKRSEILARDAQLKALKAQVNPHFLFNSLNSISALTTIDPALAREMCIRLADFLRTSLRLGERITIPLAEELALTRMYLDVEQVRFGNKLRIVQNVDAACTHCEVPALVIQPLVENAVKHGIAMMAEGGEIAIDGIFHRTHSGAFLQFTIRNPFDPEAPSTGRNGLGLRNIRERLESRYGTAARLDIQAEDRSYQVTLTLPMRVSK
jgi:two-component system, LytTR family, sensor histidine kinase AlgZ